MHNEQAKARLRAVRIKGLIDQGVGGDTWTVERKGGDGITPASSTTPASVTAYVYQEKPSKLAMALAGTPVSSGGSGAPWWVEVVAGDLEAGDVITSADDPSLIFTVHKPEQRPLFWKAIVTKR